jgi:hypothetical protein
MPVKDIHDLELHEVTVVRKRYRVVRVPGGWIYERLTKRISETESEAVAVFVPYSAEYAPVA